MSCSPLVCLGPGPMKVGMCLFFILVLSTVNLHKYLQEYGGRYSECESAARQQRGRNQDKEAGQGK